jgi:hypothetical protein
MDRENTERALARLEAALRRAESAAQSAIQALNRPPEVDPAEHSGLQERHTLLRQSVAQSVRQLDEILAGMAH